ncbi:hypothetical protein B0T26DRAFT_14139 [Lasiosphaeria miniovina]|uniref:Uncharacterized protein n=1 Tax=Lasiosphaeria miniovina TaxID=1954250 RepID=A0AA40E9I8_9PEZI|nr:uncharacterized protein B0T26DRAFT_14139 [Lasiosphaeria miniovina]KAK0733354.1 hypothetical protein B0T26DRAFT_14139 [Lasiosphaeria miniovina]
MASERIPAVNEDGLFRACQPGYLWWSCTFTSPTYQGCLPASSCRVSRVCPATYEHGKHPDQLPDQLRGGATLTSRHDDQQCTTGLGVVVAVVVHSSRILKSQHSNNTSVEHYPSSGPSFFRCCHQPQRLHIICGRSRECCGGLLLWFLHTSCHTGQHIGTDEAAAACLQGAA